MYKGDENKKSLKVLAVGNSFSVNAMKYLWNICNDGGLEEIILGNLYIAGCTLQMHVENIRENASAYTFYTNTNGEWNKEPETSVLDAIKRQDWDIITVQQSSGTSGVVSTYDVLDEIVAYLKREATNPDVKIVWHMTWAFQADFDKRGFKENYDLDQIKMYNMIVDVASNYVLKRENIVGIIPVGTTMQNIRTSYFGDNVTKDGFHLQPAEGCYSAGMTWFAYLTGRSVDGIEWTPDEYPSVKDNLAVIKESVRNAVAYPYVITESEYKSK